MGHRQDPGKSTKIIVRSLGRDLRKKLRFFDKIPRVWISFFLSFFLFFFFSKIPPPKKPNKLVVKMSMMDRAILIPDALYNHRFYFQRLYRWTRNTKKKQK